MKRIISAFVAVILLLSVAPIAFAANLTGREGDNGYVVTDHEQSTLALGVTQDIYTVKMNKDKEQNKFYLATVDLSRSDVNIYANINHNYYDGTWGLVRTSEQMKAAQERHSNPDDPTNYVEHYNVVAGVNAGYYDMGTGKPVDALAMEGKVIQDCKNRPFFAILKDGTPVIGANTSDWNKYMNDQTHGPIYEAVGGSAILVREGQNVAPNDYDYATIPNARAIIGIKQDGTTVVMGEVDGLQKPKSRGMTMRELAEVLIEAGCWIGLNLDGGGSSTYVSKQADGTLKMISSPADGYERSVSSSLFVVSTTPPSDDFASVTLTPEHEYVTPESVVPVQTVGYSSAHTRVEIPSDVQYSLSESSAELGSFDGSKFISNGKTGSAVIEAFSGDKVYGTTTIFVVDPDTLTINCSNSIYYGGKLEIDYTASYNNRTVTTKEGDFTISLSDNSIGRLDGNIFTACDENPAVTEGKITVKYKYNDTLSATLDLKFGKGPQVLFSFEDGTDKCNADDWNCRTYNNNGTDTYKISFEKVDSSGGMVHSGSHALKVTIDLTDFIGNAEGSGWYQMFLAPRTEVPLDNVVSIGAWIWVPDEETWGELCVYCDINGSYSKQGQVNNFKDGINHDEGYWIYAHKELSLSNTNNIDNTTFLAFFISALSRDDPTLYSLNNKLVFYVDDITVDYSDATPDRDAPAFHMASVLNPDGSTTDIERDTVYKFGSDVSEVRFNASVDDGNNANATGVKEVSAYIDGYEVTAEYVNESIQTGAVKLAPGVHSVIFYATDGAGNRSEIKRKFETTGNSEAATVIVKPQNPEADKILINSVYNVDVTATDISKIQKVTMVIDLVNNAEWELEHADVNPKFKLTYNFDGPIAADEKYATVTIEREKPWVYGDTNFLATLPMRSWGGNYPTIYNGKPWSPQQAWADTKDGEANPAFFPVDIKFEVDKGEIVYTEGYDPGTLPAFGSAKITPRTELYDLSKIVIAENPDKHSWHEHTPSESINDLAPTCTTNGFRNRKVCPGCETPVADNDWGEIIPATGHTYQINEETQELRCKDCNLAYTGVWEGTTYEEGKKVEGWTNDFHYYKDGKTVSGVQLIEDKYYDFGEDGICEDQIPYTGFIEVADDGTMKAVSAEATSTENKFHDYTYNINLDPEKNYYYVVGGESVVTEENKGWFNLKDELRFHIDPETGYVHLSVHAVDGRACTLTGRWTYDCLDEDCDAEPDQGDVLFFEGHDWDENYVCRNCQFHGINIENLGTLEFGGEFYKYTGSQIVPDFRVVVFGKELDAWFDAYGYDAGCQLENNIEIGTATLTVTGRGDYYGTLVGHFKIVPGSVDEGDGLQATQTNHSTIHLTWPKGIGAEYYAIYEEVAPDEWKFVQSVRETYYDVTGLELGDSYSYRVGSRAIGKADDEVYFSARWAYVKGSLEHIWDEPEEGSHEATCTEDGLLIHSCTVPGCEEQHVETVLPKLGHTVDEWTIVQDATTSAPGSKTGHCSVCDEDVTEEIPKLPYVSPGSSADTNPDNKTETVTNPDGSTTTTTTKSDGTTTETTKQTDGTVTEKVTTQDGTVTETTEQTDGTVTEKITEKDGTSVETTTTPEGVVGTTGKDASGNVTNAEVTVPQEGSEGVVKAPVEVPSAGSTKDAPQINVHVQGEKSVKMEVPVTDFGPGTVAVLVHPDGTEEVVRDCVAGEDGVILNVEGDVTLKIVENSAEFKDIERVESWAGDAIEFTSARELFSGTGNNNFQPDGKMSRGALVTLLYRLSYEPDAPALKFGDVDESGIYADAVAWADSNSIVSGYGNGTFMPDNVITREQLVTLIYQYAQFKGVVKPNTGNINTFTDADKVSNYAKEAMAWAIGAGIVSGQGDNTLNPTGSTTRAQTAVILMKLCDYMAK